MTPVVLESPFRTRVLSVQGRQLVLEEHDNVAYGRACMLDCLKRDEAPWAPHLLLTQVLDDAVLAERELGRKAGEAIAGVLGKRVIYIDRGISGGMDDGIQEALRLGQEMEYRQLGGEWAILEIASLSVEELLNELRRVRH